MQKGDKMIDYDIEYTNGGQKRKERYMTCEKCLYVEDRDKLLAHQYIGWASSKPHPCLICKRFPRDPVNYPDNYQKGE